MIQSYFVLGEYHRRAGDFEKAREAFATSEEISWVDEEGNSRIGSDYISDLIAERRRLMDAKEDE